MSTLTPRSVPSERRKSRSIAMPAGSRPFIGSSSTSSRGRCTSAMAMPSRCFMPSENWPTGFRDFRIEAHVAEHLVDAGRREVAPHASQVLEMMARAQRGPVARRFDEDTESAQGTSNGASRTPYPSSRTLPVSGCNSPQTMRERGRLAGAVGPDEADDFALTNRERHALERGAPAVRLAKTCCREERRTPSPSATAP